MYICVWTCVHEHRCPQRPEDSVRVPRAGRCHLSDVDTRNWTWVLWKNRKHPYLTTNYLSSSLCHNCKPILMGSPKGEPQQFTSAEGQNGYLLLLRETEERQHAMYLLLASYFHLASSFLLPWEEMSEGLVGGGGTFSMSLKPRRMDSLKLHDTQLCELSD